LIPDANLFIFSDFNYGILPQNLVDRLVTECKRHGVIIAADSQSSSQFGDISRFKQMNLLTPTEREARIALRDYGSGLVVLADNLRLKSKANDVILKLGADGLIVHAHAHNNKNKLVTDRLPAFNLAPKDVSGAGDSLLICTALSLATGANIWRSSYIGSLAAAIQVSRLGNIPLTAEEILEELLN
jgi:bifunctional ADP-heptose synthase (sugar kinase/adenylyltransferase)